MSGDPDDHVRAWRDEAWRLSPWALRYGALVFEQARWEVRAELARRGEVARRVRAHDAEVESRARPGRRW